MNPTRSLWYGDINSKGIGIEFKDNIEFQLVPYYSNEYKWIIPVEIKISGYELLVFAVWLKKDPKLAYSGQIIEAMRYYLPYIKDRNVVVIGDFNSNSIWDKSYRSIGNHSHLVSLLENEGIISVYHQFYGEKQGEETRFTHFFRMNPSRLFHIDYCFMSQALYNNVEHYEVGKVSDWLGKSDHAPLILDLNDV